MINIRLRQSYTQVYIKDLPNIYFLIILFTNSKFFQIIKPLNYC